MTEQTLTDEVLRAYAGTPEPRLREVLAALLRHLHAFAAEIALTPAEWQAGIEFLTAVGQTCTPERQEFILLSDVLGLSSAVAGVSAAAGATEPTVLGPFYLPGAPRLAMGQPIGRPEDGPAVLIRGQVTGTDGVPLERATLDVWQSSGNGLYDIQDPGQPAFNLRGVFTTGPDGSFAFLTARPVSYKVPDDGPVGDLLRASGRHNWRAAHVHAIVSAPGHQPVITHIFDAENPHLDSDAVFGVRDSLIREFRPAGEGDPADVAFVVDVDFALAPSTP
jgi:protocatechuate 3,4-dioxygenase beta subunit